MAIDKTFLPTRMNAFINGKLQGKTPTSALPVYTSQNPYSTGLDAFPRSPTCWLNGVKNISCFSPAQLSGANWWQRGGTLVTRKHVLFAKHFVTSVINGGTPLVFVADDNTVVRRNIIQYAYVPWTDVAIALLDNEVPANIQIAKVLPKNYADYLDLYSSFVIYCVGLDQQEKALVKAAGGLASYITSYNNQTISYQLFTVRTVDSAAHLLSTFDESIIVGDSGNPVFLILDNELVVTTTWWYPTGGPFVSSQPVYDAINELIASLSPGENYALTDVDLAVAYANMRKVYFNPNGTDSFSTLENWYQDPAFTVPATALPSGATVPVLPWGKSVQRAINGSGTLAALYW